MIRRNKAVRRNFIVNRFTGLQTWHFWFVQFIKFRAVDRLLRVIRAPHPVPEVCRKAAMILESLVSEPQNKALLLAYENAFAEILFSDTRYSDTFARILYELTSRPSNKFTAARGVWGMWLETGIIYSWSSSELPECCIGTFFSLMYWNLIKT